MPDDLKLDLGQPKGTDDPTKIASDKDKGKPDGTGNLDNGSIADIDLSDVPEVDRERFKKLLIPKAKNLQSAMSKKSEELKTAKEALDKREATVADLEKWRKEIAGDPKLGTAFEKFFYDYKSGKTITPVKVDKDLKLIDQLIEAAKQREVSGDENATGDRVSLERLKTILGEAIEGHGTDVKTLTDKVKALEKVIEEVGSTSQIGLKEKVKRDVGTLETRFGKEIVDKYRVNLEAMALKYPGSDITKVFYQIADDADLKQALLKEADVDKKKEFDKKKGGIEPAGAGYTGSVESPKDKAGRVIMGGEDGFLKRILRKRGILS